MANETNFSKLILPSNHQYVLIESDNDIVSSNPISKLPMTFQITYNGEQEDPPTITLLINPENMVLTFGKKVNPSFARSGYIVEEWGEHQDTIACSGKIGGYYIKNPTISAEAGPINFNGLNRYDRTKSESFKNLYYLLILYRNNGAIYQRTTKGPSILYNKKLIKDTTTFAKVAKRVPYAIENIKNRIDRLGDLFMIYDNYIYQGAFDNFSIEEVSSSPFNLSYNFTFTVQRRFLSDYRNYNYYNQVFIESSDVFKNKNKEFTKKFMEPSLKIESIAKKDESQQIKKVLGITNDGTMDTASSVNDAYRTQGYIDEMVSQWTKNGYKYTDDQYNKLADIAKTPDKIYADIKKSENDLKNLAKEVGKNTTSNEATISAKANDIAKSQIGLKQKLNQK